MSVPCAASSSHPVRPSAKSTSQLVSHHALARQGRLSRLRDKARLWQLLLRPLHRAPSTEHVRRATGHVGSFPTSRQKRTVWTGMAESRSVRFAWKNSSRETRWADSNASAGFIAGASASGGHARALACVLCMSVITIEWRLDQTRFFALMGRARSFENSGDSFFFFFFSFLDTIQRCTEDTIGLTAAHGF